MIGRTNLVMFFKNGKNSLDKFAIRRDECWQKKWYSVVAEWVSDFVLVKARCESFGCSWNGTWDAHRVGGFPPWGGWEGLERYILPPSQGSWRGLGLGWVSFFHFSRLYLSIRCCGSRTMQMFMERPSSLSIADWISISVPSGLNVGWTWSRAVVLCPAVRSMRSLVWRSMSQSSRAKSFLHS